MYDSRLRRIAAVFAAGFALLGLRAFTLQVVDRDDVLAEHERRVRGRFVLAPRRGAILWADGSAAAHDVPGFRVDIDPRAFEAVRVRCRDCGAGAAPRRAAFACAECGSADEPERLPMPDLSELASLLGAREPELRASFERAIRQHQRAPQHRWQTLVESVDRETAVRVALAASRFPGVAPRAKLVRETDAVAAPVVGTTRDAWAEEFAELTSVEREARGERRYSAAEVYAMRFGARGLEARFDDALRGDPGTSCRAPRRRDGTPRDPVVLEPVRDGADLRTTLRRGVQAAAQEVVASAPGNAAAVVLDVQDGAVVAIASRSDGRLHRAVCSIRPGSVFKIVTALALLDAGVATAETVLCEGRGRVPSGARYVCEGTHGSVAFHEAFAESCNAYFATMAERAGPEAMRRACEELGLDRNPRLHLPGTPCGLEYAGEGGTWRPADLQKLGIGQGKALVSPLQVAVAYARVASEGLLVVPHLVADAAPAPRRSAGIARAGPALREAARRVVTEGTARNVPGLGVLDAAGKSGTGDLDVEGTSNNAWFVAFAPASAPRYVAVVVHESVTGHGASTAGPAAARLLEEALR